MRRTVLLVVGCTLALTASACIPPRGVPPVSCGGSIETACIRDLSGGAASTAEGTVSGDQEIWYRWPTNAVADEYRDSCVSDPPSTTDDDVVVTFYFGDDAASAVESGDDHCAWENPGYVSDLATDYHWARVTSGSGASFHYTLVLEQLP
jgi:hypothetical protein